ncbi:hypothetical protein EYF80_020048 [Liparis tanakae]|uniref:Uncharacterized protein n=1 Tax=Liparis tanakae TaxID=230148 RepID=A0A4Z2HXC7_9TELE|nr:hypothetical protein EYF80_020048 [Liparis tanakae]
MQLHNDGAPPTEGAEPEGHAARTRGESAAKAPSAPHGRNTNTAAQSLHPNPEQNAYVGDVHMLGA